MSEVGGLDILFVFLYLGIELYSIYKALRYGEPLWFLGAIAANTYYLTLHVATWRKDAGK